MTTRRQLSDRQLRMLGVIGSFVTALVIAQAVTGFLTTPDYGEFVDLGQAPDVLHERATAWEALFGDPYRPVGEIMADHGFPEIDGGIAVRTPGAFLLQLPLLLVPESVLLTVTVSMVLVLLALSLYLTFRISGIDARTLSWLGPAYFISLPAVMSLLFGSVMVLIPVVLILVTWLFRNRAWAGIPLGLAAASRLWPLLLLLGYWIIRRRRTVIEAGATFVTFTAFGLLLRGVTLTGTFEALSTAGGSWLANSQNASLAHLVAPLGVNVWIAVIAAAMVGAWLAIRNRAQAIPITTIAALIASPLSWPTYAISALPALAGWGATSAAIHLGIVALPWIGWMLIPAPWWGYAMCVSLACLLLLVARSHNSLQN